MPRILLIDDDRIIRKLVETYLTSLGYDVTTAGSGAEGLKVIGGVNPDIVVTDKIMPGLDGFEVTRRLRREPKFANTPIIVLTGESDLEDKLGAFEAGADDYLSKPFDNQELAARITALLRRSRATSTSKDEKVEEQELAHLIAVHSLRGGIGCSSLTTNMALAMQGLWQLPTLLIDMVLGAGQQSLMLNKQMKHTWANLFSFEPEEIDVSTIASIVTKHSSGLNAIIAPADPIIAEQASAELINVVLSLLSPRFKYIVADLPHNFSNTTVEVLDMADTIFLVLAPDVASIRAASTALNVYSELGYESDKVQLILNATFDKGRIPTAKIETALKQKIAFEIPFEPISFINGINKGIPIVLDQPKSKLGSLFEQVAFMSSEELHKSIPPANPSDSWHRVNQQLKLFQDKSKSKKRSNSVARLLFSSD